MPTRARLITLLLALAATAGVSGLTGTPRKPWLEMDYGPFLTTTVACPRPAGNVAYKGVTIRLGDRKTGEASVVFDTDLLRYAAGWLGFLNLNGVVFDGRHWEYPSIDGEQVFGNPITPGWESDGSFRDPRALPYGPLPRRWAHYKGLYLHGNRVLLSYTVNGAAILETPDIETGGSSIRAFSRTLNIGPLPAATSVQIAQEEHARADVVALDTLDRAPSTTAPARSLVVLRAVEDVTLGRMDEAELAKGLVAHWRMDEHFGPTIGNAAGPHSQGSLKNAAWTDGKTGSALRFDGETSVVEIGPSPFDFSAGDFTIAAWVRGATAFGATASPDFRGGTIFGKSAAASFSIRQSRVVFGNGGAGELMSRREIGPSEWHHLVVVCRKPTEQCELFIDGQPDTRGALKIAADSPDRLLTIGERFLGTLDEIRLYSRALQPDEIAGLIGRRIERDRITAVAAVGEADEASWDLQSAGHVRLRFPTGRATRIKILVWRGQPRQLASFASLVRRSAPPADLERFRHGGPTRWKKALVTHGTRGPDTGPYAVDRIAWPGKNPWQSWMRFSGFDFFSDDRRAALATWNGDVWTVDDIDASLGRLTWRRIATGLFQPLGLKIVDDRIYALGRDQITRLHDLNGDGEADFYENFNNDHQVSEHFHEFALDLQVGPDGAFYYHKAARHARDALFPQHGTLLRVARDGSKTTIVATGFRAPNGLGIGPAGQMLVSDNQGHWVPANRINWIEPGGFYGNRWSHFDGVPKPDHYDPPLAWMPNSVDRSPGTFAWVPDTRWGPLAGGVISSSYGMGRLFHVMSERVGGTVQGGVVPLPLEFDTGVMRARFRPRDGQLYLCGLFGWAGNKEAPGGFYRVRYTGKPLYLPTQLAVASDGVLVTFTSPLQPESALNVANYAASRWNYKWTATYGSPEYRLNGEQGRDAVPIERLALSADRRTVFLRIPSVRPVMQMRIHARLIAADGTAFESDIHHTIHALGASSGMDLLGSETSATSGDRAIR